MNTTTTETKIYTEHELRGLNRCVGCQKPKDHGTVVCWDCFKYTEEFTPLKYWDGSTEDWQRYLATARKTAV